MCLCVGVGGGGGGVLMFSAETQKGRHGEKERKLYPSIHLTAWLIKPGGEKAPFVL